MHRILTLDSPGHAPTALPPVRARAEAALQRTLAACSASSLGRVCGRPHTTICRRGDDLAQWPAGDLLALAEQYEPLRHGLRAALSDDASTGRLGAEADAHAAVIAAADLISGATAALADGRIDQAEALRLQISIGLVTARLAQLDADLRSRLEAAR